MPLFDEILFSTDIIADGAATGGPTYANSQIRNPATGIYKINVNRYDFVQEWVVTLDMLTPTQLEYVVRFFGGGFGSGYPFRVCIVSDFYMIDQVIGTGNGIQVAFPIYKTYLRPGASHSYLRRIIKPATNTNVVGGVTLYEADGVTTRTFPSVRGAGVGVPAPTVKLNSTPTALYSINNTTGVITMNSAPGAGVLVKVSMEFETPMRFMDNSLRFTPSVASKSEGLTLIEVLAAELGIA